MARIDLRNCTIYMKDGFGGTAAVNQASPAPASGDTTLVIDTVAGFPNSGTEVPVGAGFSVAGSTRTRYGVTAVNNNEVQTVTITATGGTWNAIFGGQTSANIAYDALASAVKSALEAMSSIGTNNVSVSGNAGGPYTIEFIGTLAATNVATMTTDATNLTVAGTAVVAVVHSGATTWKLTFTPALATADGVPVNDAVITFLPAQIEIKIGDGDFKYTEADQFKYDLDRGVLDTVRTGDDQPMEITMNFTFEHVKSTGTEAVTPIEALKGTGAAASWVSSSSDQCEPYSVDVVVANVPPCGTSGSDTYLFPDFRSEKRDFDVKNATIAVSGKCNAIEPIITRA